MAHTVICDEARLKTGHKWQFAPDVLGETRLLDVRRKQSFDQLTAVGQTLPYDHQQ